MTQTTEFSLISHLMRRAGVGLSYDELEEYAELGYEGAVEAVRMDNSAVEIETIGNADPEGICGSGLIDLLAELRRTQRMPELGVFNNYEWCELTPAMIAYLNENDINNK